MKKMIQTNIDKRVERYIFTVRKRKEIRYDAKAIIPT
jgi:hypothetical protein